MRLDAAGPAIPARRSRRNLAAGAEALQPAHRAGDADPETLGRRVARQAPDDNGLNHPLAKRLGWSSSTSSPSTAALCVARATRGIVRVKSYAPCWGVRAGVSFAAFSRIIAPSDGFAAEKSPILNCLDSAWRRTVHG